MKLYAIFANDNVTGTTFKLFKHAIATFKDKGYQIDELNLYDKEKEIPFFRHDRNYMESHPFYMENQKRFMQADALLLVFPLYWYSVPAILKAWLDLINGWAYKYESGMYAKPLHKIKKVFIIYACMQNKENLQKSLGNPLELQLLETCKFIGIPEIHTHIVDNVNKLKPEEIEKHLKDINKFCCGCA
jgi:putative NADPH-quinone reductase